MKKGMNGTVPELVTAAFMAGMLILFTACQSGAAGEKPPKEQKPETLVNGVYLSGDGKFTVKADEEKWQPAGREASWELVLRANGNIRISFTPANGLSKEMVAEVETSFADSCVEALKEEYPDIRKTQICKVNEEMAGFGMTMTDRSSGFRMYQFFYLASDGENGYLITAVFPEKEEALKQEVMQVIESLAFYSK